MIIRSVEFAGAIGKPGQEPPGALPQIAFSGRSNVGKSSLINTLLGRTRKKIAHVSSKPGKTRTLNFYEVNGRFYLVDLPGFGYAKVPGAVRERWRRLVEWYLSGNEALRGVVHLVDGRHPPFPLDQVMMALLADHAIPALVVLTKIDRVPKGKRSQTLKRATERLGVQEDQLVPFSARTGEGRELLLEALGHLLGSPAQGSGS